MRRLRYTVIFCAVSLVAWPFALTCGLLDIFPDTCARGFRHDGRER